jgi:amino acid transporter
MFGKKQNEGKATLSVFQVAIMTVISVVSLRASSVMAVEGWASILMFLIPAVLFLIPVALVSAELGTTYKGGVYVWVREAFGDRLGFLAVWLQWIQNVVWYPVQLAFVAAALAFMIGHGGLSESGWFTFSVIVIFYWLATLLALRGGNLFAKVSSIGGLVGTIIPAGILVVLGIIWVALDRPISHTLTDSSFLPTITGISSFVLIVSNVLAFAGMESNAVHAGDMKNPRKSYAKAIAIAFVLILVVMIVPTLAIAAVPAENVSMSNSVLLAFKSYFDAYGIGWVGNVVAAAIVFGAISSVITWVAGPSRGVMDAARHGLLPPLLQKRNKYGVQIGILVPQGIIVTILAMIYILIPNVSAVFLTLTGMAAALYVVMYIIMFAAAIRLRQKDSKVSRGYKVPLLGLVAGTGLVSCFLAFIMSFIPGAGEAAIPAHIFPFIVAAVVVGLGVPPLIFYAIRKPKWDMRTTEEKSVPPHHKPSQKFGTH